MRPAHLQLKTRGHIRPYASVSSPSQAKATPLHSHTAQKQEVRVCTNKTCKKQGSLQVAQFLEDLGLEELSVARTGCLAKCGSGPNIYLANLDVLLNHISTPAKMAQVLQDVCSIEIPETLLKATELRLAGNAEARSGRLDAAIRLYNRGINLQPPRGLHLLYSNRAGARLTLGDAAGALEDARLAAIAAPPDFTTAAVRQVEALSALERYEEARVALQEVGRTSPDFAATRDYKDALRQLDQILAH